MGTTHSCGDNVSSLKFSKAPRKSFKGKDLKDIKSYISEREKRKFSTKLVRERRQSISPAQKLKKGNGSISDNCFQFDDSIFRSSITIKKDHAPEKREMPVEKMSNQYFERNITEKHTQDRLLSKELIREKPSLFEEKLIKEYENRSDNSLLFHDEFFPSSKTIKQDSREMLVQKMNPPYSERIITERQQMLPSKQLISERKQPSSFEEKLQNQYENTSDNSLLFDDSIFRSNITIKQDNVPGKKEMPVEKMSNQYLETERKQMLPSKQLIREREQPSLFEEKLNKEYENRSDNSLLFDDEFFPSSKTIKQDSREMLVPKMNPLYLERIITERQQMLPSKQPIGEREHHKEYENRNDNNLLFDDFPTSKTIKQGNTPEKMEVSMEKMKNPVIDLFPFEDILFKFYKDKTLTDVVLQTSTVSFCVHKLVLCCRSGVFSAMFSEDFNSDTRKCVDISEDANTLRSLLLYIYTNQVEEMRWQNVLDLLKAAEKYELLDLKEKCRIILKSKISQENFCGVLSFANINEEIEIFAAVLDFISQIPDIFNSKEWKVFKKENPELALNVMERIINSLKNSLK